MNFDNTEETILDFPPEADFNEGLETELETIAEAIEEEKERIRTQRAAEGKTGRPAKSDLQRELESEYQEKKKSIAGGRFRVNEEAPEEPSYMPLQGIGAKTIISGLDNLMQGLLLTRHPNPESVPLRNDEKKALSEPLKLVLDDAGAEISPKTALLLTASIIILPRVLPVVVPMVQQYILTLQKNKDERETED